MLKWFPFVRLLSPRRAKPAGNSNDTGGEESDLEKMKQVNVLTSLLRATEVQQASRFQVNRLKCRSGSTSSEGAGRPVLPGRGPAGLSVLPASWWKVQQRK